MRDQTNGMQREDPFRGVGLWGLGEGQEQTDQGLRGMDRQEETAEDFPPGVGSPTPVATSATAMQNWPLGPIHRM